MAGAATAPINDVTIIVTPLADSDDFLVRLDGERDAFTVSSHPVEAAGWLLWHVRGCGPDVALHVRGPDSPDALLSTSVLPAMEITDFLIEDDAMETPVALQHLPGSAFNLRQPSVAR
jgi:hypothetical protein